MPKPVTSKGKSGDKQADGSQSPNPATARYRASVAACSFDCAAFQIEAPSQHKGDWETKRDQSDKELLKPIRSMKDRQDCSNDLNGGRSGDDVGNRHAVNASVLQFLEKALHGCGFLIKPPP